MQTAQRVLGDVVAGIPERDGVNVGLRIYGHEGNNTPEGQAESCQSSELVAEIRPVSKARKERIRDRIDELQPTGWTPLALSLERGGDDFQALDSVDDAINVIVLVTDGLETCGGDPCAAAGQIKRGTADVTTSVVGFALTEDEQATLSCIAEEGGGDLLGAEDADELSDAIFKVLEEEVPDIERPTPATRASGPVGTRDNSIPFGEAGEVGDGWVFTVLDVIPNGNDLVFAENQFNELPVEGNQFFIVRAAMTYEGSKESATAFELQYSLVGELNKSYQTFTDSCGVVPEDLGFNSTDVFQGGTIEGNLCWSVPSGEVDSLVLYVSSLFSDDDRVFFSLQ